MKELEGWTIVSAVEGTDRTGYMDNVTLTLRRGSEQKKVIMQSFLMNYGECSGIKVGVSETELTQDFSI